MIGPCCRAGPTMRRCGLEENLGRLGGRTAGIDHTCQKNRSKLRSGWHGGTFLSLLWNRVYYFVLSKVWVQCNFCEKTDQWNKEITNTQYLKNVMWVSMESVKERRSWLTYQKVQSLLVLQCSPSLLWLKTTRNCLSCSISKMTSFSEMCQDAAWWRRYCSVSYLWRNDCSPQGYDI